jgi:putative tricarboxylic transport membrane protein
MAFCMRRFGFPVAPVLLGIVLGPLIEQEFRRAMSISGGDIMIFATRPIALTLFALTALSLIVPLARKSRNMTGLGALQGD